jgi:hypothetical protein
MVEETKEKAAVIEEIQRRIAHLISNDQISEAQKIIIAREVLNIVEHGKRDSTGEVQ